jgi:hypothetical protein
LLLITIIITLRIKLNTKGVTFTANQLTSHAILILSKII